MTILKYIIILSFCLYLNTAYGDNKYFFDYNEGLSNSLINDVYQDHLGYIWVATEDGLNRFDGLKFKTFTEEEHGLKANYITTITEDSENNMWIGLVNGLQKYDPVKEIFTEIKIFISDTQIHPFVTGITEDNNGNLWIATSGYGLVQIPKEIGRPRYSTRINNQLGSLFMRVLFKDSDGNLWIGSDDNGMSSFNPENGQIKHYSKSDSSYVKINSNSITSIEEGPNGIIYFGSLDEGLCKLNKKNNEITRIYFPTHSRFRLPVKELFLDSRNRLWVGTDGLGLYQYNEENDILNQYLPSNSTFDFSKSKVHCIVEDNGGNIWTGIFQKGLFLFSETKKMFNNYGYRAFSSNSIGSSCVTSIDGDAKELWLGTDGDGLYRINKENGYIVHINLGKAINDDASNTIFSLFNTKTDILWIGTYSNGLIRYNKKSGALHTFKKDPNNPKSLPSNNIGCIKQAENGELWIGTLGEGLVHFNTKKNEFTKGLNIPDSLNNLIPKLINDIYIDKNNNFWIGTYQGLIYSDSKNQSLTIFTSENKGLPSNIIYSIKPDNQGNIWAGTYKGLIKINPDNMTFSSLSIKHGLVGNVVCAIEEDNYNQLWISTHKGLSKFNPSDSTFINYYASDGLQSNEFYRNSVFKSAQGSIYFGGINGVTEINNNYNQFVSEPPEIMLTDFRRFNKPVKIGEKTGKRTILSKSIIVADTIHLLEKDNVFSISFTSKELSNQSLVSYEYKMDGFDLNWTKSSANNRTATYTNLPHGTYIFNVRGVDKKLYSTPRKLTIIIHPPWYKTNAATALWIFIFVLILLGGFQLYKQTFRRIEAEKTNEKKMQFFINISHEIRTPLSLIIDPLEKLLSQESSNENNRLYGIMQQNANRIFRLINQLMDVRKLDKGRMLVKYQETNMMDFVKEIAQSYNYLASSKEIDFKVKSTNPDLKAWIDPLNFEKVVINLLSNAFKFTNNKIEVALAQIKDEHGDDIAQIIVSDNGVGVKKTDLEKIFNRFYQVNSPETRNITGTGIGLHLSRSLVALHKGKLFAESGENGIGSRFIVQIPLGNKHLPQEDLIVDDNILPAPSNSIRVIPKTFEDEGSSKPKTSYKIMIVEDELEIRNYLKEELQNRYNVISYENGKEAFANVFNDKPDLIVSDIMMPVMDGITFCKKVKNHIETNHIPVILLTALSKDEDKAEGIETGADMYLVKPFNTSFLQKSISNLIENRRKIFAKLENKQEKYQVEPIEIKSHDEILMQKVMTIIRDNISNNELNVEMLADGVGISRVHMHRKLKEISNQSARDLIKNVRMKQAAYILVNKKLNISDVAYSLGYTSLSHFSTSFKGYYGVSPKEYIEQQNLNKE